MQKFLSILMLMILFNSHVKAQYCSASFVYSLSPNGNITFSNTSVPSNSTMPVSYVWQFGNGQTFTTSSLSQTVTTTYTASGNYYVELAMSSPTTYTCSHAVWQIVSYSIQGCPLTTSMTALNTAPYSPTVNFTSICTGTTPGTTYSWDFGDGTSGIGTNPTHVYTANGGFNCKLIATNNSTCSAFIAHTELNIGVGSLISVCGYTPSISYTTGNNGATTFTVNATGPHWNMWWDFGDAAGFRTETRTPYNNHLFFNGTHSVSIIMDSPFLNGCPSAPLSQGGIFTFTLATFVSSTGNPCDANSAFTYSTGNSGTVQFSKTAPSTNTNIAYSWYFGDGVSSNQINPSHTYSSAGNYSVTLISYDLAYPLYGPMDTLAAPCHTFSVANVNITNVPCIANSNFSMQPNGVPQNYMIIPSYLYNVSSAVWDWGDGSGSNSLFAFHTYSAPGNYNICLTVTTTCGATSSVCTNQYLSKGTSGDMVYVMVVAPEITNGIGENMVENMNFVLYPNPSNDGLLNLSSDNEFINAEIKVYDLLGKEVIELSAPNNERSFQVDLSALNNGIYFLRVRSPERSSINKFIIAR